MKHSNAGLSQEKKNVKLMPNGSITLQFAGELILVHCLQSEFHGLFKRYQSIFEAFANMNREERLLNYKFLNGLMLTSHAKKQMIENIVDLSLI